MLIMTMFDVDMMMMVMKMICANVCQCLPLCSANMKELPIGAMVQLAIVHHNQQYEGAVIALHQQTIKGGANV